MVKHEIKPQVCKSDIYSTLWSDIKPAVETDYKKITLTFSRQKGRRNNRHQQRFCLSGNILIITCLRVLFQIYNH